MTAPCQGLHTVTIVTTDSKPQQESVTIISGLWGDIFPCKFDHCALQLVVPYLWIFYMHAFQKNDNNLFCLHTENDVMYNSNKFRLLWMVTALNIFFFLYCGTFPCVWMWCMCPSCFPYRLRHLQRFILYMEAPYLWIKKNLLSWFLEASFISRSTLLSRNYGTDRKTEQEIKKTITQHHKPTHIFWNVKYCFEFGRLYGH